MFIQGNLQNVFDALFAMGMINPALKADWAPMDQVLKKQPTKLHEVIRAVNRSGNTTENIIENLRSFDQETLLMLAMEVAREYIDFEDRKTIH